MFDELLHSSLQCCSDALLEQYKHILLQKGFIYRIFDTNVTVSHPFPQYSAITFTNLTFKHKNNEYSTFHLYKFYKHKIKNISQSHPFAEVQEVAMASPDVKVLPAQAETRDRPADLVDPEARDQRDPMESQATPDLATTAQLPGHRLDIRLPNLLVFVLYNTQLHTF